MIRAAALSYAIVFSLLIGLICSGVLFIAAAQKQVEVIHNSKERVLFDSYAGIQYGMRAVAPGDSAVIIHGNSDTCEVKNMQWGAFSLVTCSTHKFPYSRTRAALVGRVNTPRLPCLFLPGTMNTLKITGETRIEGTAAVPDGQIERAYIAGKNYAFPELIFGKAIRSEPALPALKAAWANLIPAALSGKSIPLPFIAADSAYSFQHTTTYFQSVQPLVIGNKLSGNVIIHSFDSIFVEARAVLTNVILIAPVVRFEAGFRGSVQVLANERITCEENVRLLYPSVCILNELAQRSELTRRIIHLDKNALVIGGILVTSQRPDFRKMPVCFIDETAVAAGLLYISGETELRGKVFGSLYTEQFITRAGGGVYTNHLVDATISGTRFPAGFLLPDWLKEQSAGKTKIIAWL